MPNWAKIVLAVVAAAVCSVVIERLIVTDREAIKASLERIRDCLLKHDLDGCMEEVAEDYSFKSLTAENLRNYGKPYIEASRILKVEFLGRKIEVSDGTATVHLDVLVKVRDEGNQAPVLIKVEVLYGKKTGGWKITGVDFQ